MNIYMIIPSELLCESSGQQLDLSRVYNPPSLIVTPTDHPFLWQWYWKAWTQIYMNGKDMQSIGKGVWLKILLSGHIYYSPSTRSCEAGLRRWLHHSQGLFLCWTRVGYDFNKTWDQVATELPKSCSQVAEDINWTCDQVNHMTCARLTTNTPQGSAELMTGLRESTCMQVPAKQPWWTSRFLIFSKQLKSLINLNYTSNVLILLSYIMYRNIY